MSQRVESKVGCFATAKTRVNCNCRSPAQMDMVYEKSTSRAFGITLLVDDSLIGSVEVLQDASPYLEMVKTKTGGIDFVYHAFQVRCSPFTTLGEVCEAITKKLAGDIKPSEAKNYVTLVSVHVAGEDATLRLKSRLKSLHVRNGDTVQIVCVQLPQTSTKRSSSLMKSMIKRIGRM